MLHSNIYINKDDNKVERTKSQPIYIVGKSVSYNPGSTPNTPPINTPPNINVIRELYLDYLTSFKK